MASPRLVALDLSLTATGIAWTHNAGTQPIGVRTVKSRTTGHERINQILEAVAEATWLLHDPEPLVTIEGLPLYSGKGNTTILLAELHGVVKQWLWDNDIRYVVVAPQARAKYATGKGNAGKDEVMLAVARRYADVVTVADNNQADAVALLAMATDRYGFAYVEVPAVNRTALSRVEWPQVVTVDG